MTDQSSAPSVAPNLPARRFVGSFGVPAPSTPVFALEEASYRFLPATPAPARPVPLRDPRAALFARVPELTRGQSSKGRP